MIEYIVEYIVDTAMHETFSSEADSPNINVNSFYTYIPTEPDKGIIVRASIEGELIKIL